MSLLYLEIKSYFIPEKDVANPICNNIVMKDVASNPPDNCTDALLESIKNTINKTFAIINVMLNRFTLFLW